MNPTTRILVFYGAIAVVVSLLRVFANTFVSRVAFSWMGPKPNAGENWAAYQWRWAVYSFDWLVQMVGLFVLVNGALVLFPQTQQHQLLWVFQFALALGLGMALLAFVAFVAKAAKAHFFGPNPQHELPSQPQGAPIDI
jgi:hypothetical protein